MRTYTKTNPCPIHVHTESREAARRADGIIRNLAHCPHATTEGKAEVLRITARGFREQANAITAKQRPAGHPVTSQPLPLSATDRANRASLHATASRLDSYACRIAAGVA